MQHLRYIELFCGLGGFHEVFKDIQCVYAYDKSSRSKKLCETNYNTCVWTRFNADQIPAFDMLCSAPYDPPSQLPVILQVVESHKPKYILLDLPKRCENIEQFVESLKAVQPNYHVYTSVLNAIHFNLAQYRERQYVVAIQASSNNTGFQWSDVVNTSTKTPKKVVTIRDVMDTSDGLTSKREELEEKYDIVPFSGRDLAHRPMQTFSLIRKDNGKGGRQGERIYSIDHPGITICYCSGSPGSYTGLYDFDGVIRNLTVTEALRMLSDSVCIPIIQAIANRLFS